MTNEIASAADIRPVGPDDLADVRSLHAISFKRLAAHRFTEEEISAFTDHVYAIGYTEALSEAITRQQLFGAWVGGQLVGTAGWTAGDGNMSAARIRWVYVRPLFAGVGLGTRLVETAEAAASKAGVGTLAIEAPVSAADFFLGLGYDITSHGVRTLAPGQSLPVAYMRKQLDNERSRVLTDEAADEL